MKATVRSASIQNESVTTMRRKLFNDQAGGVAVEYGLTLPMVLVTVLGGFELGYMAFANATLEGAMRDASRLGLTGLCNLQEARSEVIQRTVTEQMTDCPTAGPIELSTKVYDTFAEVGEGEPYTDSDNNGSYTAGETFQDLNGNGVHDEDLGVAGLGGPGAVVYYEASVPFTAMTPIFTHILKSVQGGEITLSAGTAVRNEPFGLVDAQGTAIGCEDDTQGAGA